MRLKEISISLARAQDGNVFIERKDYAIATPESLMTPEEIRKKHHRLARTVIDPGCAREIERAVD